MKNSYFDDGASDSGRKKRENVPPSQDKRAMERMPGRIVLWRLAKPVLGVLIGLVVVTLLAIYAWNYVNSHYIAPVDANSTEQVEFTIERGSSLTTISKQLEQAGLIRNATVFKYYVDFSDMSSKIIAGTYTLSPAMTFNDIVDVIKRPTEIKSTVTITFKEGYTVEQIAEAVREAGVVKNTVEFEKLFNDEEAFASYDFIADVVLDNQKSVAKRKYVLEGYLFPDTYNFYTTSSEETVIKRLLDQFNKVFTDAYKARAKELGMTVDEVVTLASIIEREAKLEDFKKVSAVFHNRLNANMKLGSCATVQYFKNERRLVWTTEELQEDSPYNTYIYSGLPIGPICNPSKAAIEAALYPDEQAMDEGYLYFCLGDPETGETYFFKTSEEHEAFKQQYQNLWIEHDRNLNTAE